MHHTKKVNDSLKLRKLSDLFTRLANDQDQCASRFNKLWREESNDVDFMNPSEEWRCVLKDCSIASERLEKFWKDPTLWGDDKCISEYWVQYQEDSTTLRPGNPN